MLGLWQNHIERILAGWIGELSVPIHYGREVTGFAQDETGVDVQLSDGESLRAQYLVGCDGGRSLIRKAAGIDFPGWDPITSNIIVEVEMAEEPPEWGIRRDALGIHSLSRLEDGMTVRVLVTEPHVGATTEPTLRDLSQALIAAYGTDYGVHNPTWLSRFTTRLGRPRPTATDGSCWPAAPHPASFKRRLGGRWVQTGYMGNTLDRQHG